MKRALISFALLCAGCSGGGGSNPTPVGSTGTPPPPVLTAGATYQYSGTEQVTITYTTPTSTNVNSLGAYTYVANETINNAPSGAPAPFDVNRVTTYTTTQTPSSGTQLISTTNDNYESQTTSGANETIALAGSKTTTVEFDVSAANRLGSGPFNENSTSTTTYTTPETLAVYPLTAGTQITEVQARTVQATTTDVNAAGTIAGGGTTNTTYNSDGSYTRSQNNAVGSTQQQTVNGNGTGTRNLTGTDGTITQTAIAAPSGGTIPIVVTTNGTAKSYTAQDWYPNGLVPTPLASSTRTVKGPATLPSSCNVTGTPPAVIEVDLASSNFDPFGSTTATTQQNFLTSGGVEICRLQTTTTVNYDVTTGLPTSTNVTTSSEALGQNNQGIAAVRRAP